jgi:hypothetical protein
MLHEVREKVEGKGAKHGTLTEMEGSIPLTSSSRGCFIKIKDRFHMK